MVYTKSFTSAIHTYLLCGQLKKPRRKSGFSVTYVNVYDIVVAFTLCRFAFGVVDARARASFVCDFANVIFFVLTKRSSHSAEVLRLQRERRLCARARAKIR